MRQRATKVVLYARVSSKEQEREGFSIAAQLELLRRKGSEAGFEVVREFVEAETAKRAGRREFTAMLAFLKETPSVRGVLVEKTDRLSRNFRDVVAIDDLVSEGLEVHLVREGKVYSRNSRSTDRFEFALHVLLARLYIDRLSEEVRKGMTQKAEEGFYPSHPPVGYRSVVIEGKNAMEPDPEMAPILRRVFERYATGRFSVAEVADRAREEGMLSYFDKPVTTSGVHRVLRNPTYTGRFDWAGKTYEGRYEPIVPRDLFVRVQETLTRPLKGRRHPVASVLPTKRQYNRHDFLLAGLVTCGDCGHALVGQVQRGHLKRRDYIYYNCRNRCRSYVREEILLDQFTDEIRRLHFDEKTMTLLAGEIRATHADEERFHAESVQVLREARDGVQARLNRLLDALLDGTITKEAYDEKARELRAQQDRYDREIDAHKVADRGFADDAVLMFELARQAETTFVAAKPAEKRNLLRFLCSNPKMKEGRLVVEFREPFDSLASTIVAAKSEATREETVSGLSPCWLGD